MNTSESMTLTEKEESLKQTVGLPTAQDWQLLGDDEEQKALLVQCLNKALLDTLGFMERSSIRGWPPPVYGRIAAFIYSRIGELEKRYPEAGLRDSEAYLTVARFFGANVSPAMYDYMRHARGWESFLDDVR